MSQSCNDDVRTSVQFGVFVASVALEVFSDRDRLFDEMVHILRNGRSEAYKISSRLLLNRAPCADTSTSDGEIETRFDPRQLTSSLQDPEDLVSGNALHLRHTL